MDLAKPKLCVGEVFSAGAARRAELSTSNMAGPCRSWVFLVPLFPGLPLPCTRLGRKPPPTHTHPDFSVSRENNAFEVGVKLSLWAFSFRQPAWRAVAGLTLYLCL